MAAGPWVGMLKHDVVDVLDGEAVCRRGGHA